MLHWLQVAWSTYVLHTERNNGYAWWSGPGSDIGQVTILSAGVGLVWAHVNCHEPGCKKVVRHRFHDPQTGEVFGVCGKHHPAKHHREEGHPLRRLHELYHGAPEKLGERATPAG